MFTRATVNSGTTPATKDAACVAEFGAGYRAASRPDVAALWRSPFGSTTFALFGETLPYQVTSTSGTSQLTGTSTATVPQACVRLVASLQFTRTAVNSGGTTATKDAACVAEFGAGYRAASRTDVAALWRSAFGSTSFALFGETTPFYVTSTSGSSQLTSPGGLPATVPQACVSW